MGWNNLSIPKLQRLHRWSLGIDKLFHPIHYYGCKYLSMLGLNLSHISKRGPRLNIIGPDYETLAPRGNVSHDINHVYGRPLSTSVGCNINMICSALFPQDTLCKVQLRFNAPWRGIICDDQIHLQLPLFILYTRLRNDFMLLGFLFVTSWSWLRLWRHCRRRKVLRGVINTHRDWY